MTNRPARQSAIPAGAGLPVWLGAHHPLGLMFFGASLLLALALFVDAPLYLIGAALPVETRQAFGQVTGVGNGGWSLCCAVGLILGFGRAARRGGWRAAILYRHGAGLAGYVLTCILVSGVMVNVLKALIGRARPGGVGDGAFAFGMMAQGRSWESFPSAHTATIFALAVALSGLFPRLRLIFLTMALWVGLSRIMIGAHWASDVCAGAALGTACALGARLAFARRGRAFVWRAGVFSGRTRRLSQLVRHDLLAQAGQIGRAIGALPLPGLARLRRTGA